jgi:hypothetical protein
MIEDPTVTVQCKTAISAAPLLEFMTKCHVD